jgi:hypothetical protein
MDSVVANTTLFSMNSEDDESMMGYSLASNQEAGRRKNYSNAVLSTGGLLGKSPSADDEMEDNSIYNPSTTGNKQNTGQNESESHESSTTSDPSQKNPLFAGVQNLLNNPAEFVSPIQGAYNVSQGQKKKWSLGFGQKRRPQGFLSSDSETDHAHEEMRVPPNGNSEKIIDDSDDREPVVIVNAPQLVDVINTSNDFGATYETEDEAGSSYKEEDSVKGCESSVMSGYSSAQMSDADPFFNVVNDTSRLSTLGYFDRKDSFDDRSDLELLPHISPAPSEEMDDMLILRSPIMGNSILGGIGAEFADDVSDAPSDERKNGLPNFGVMQNDRVGSTESMRSNSPLDNDPAVVEYLIKERRSIKQRTRKKREDRKQPPVTMEV